MSAFEEYIHMDEMEEEIYDKIEDIEEQIRILEDYMQQKYREIYTILDSYENTLDNILEIKKELVKEILISNTLLGK